MGLQIRDDRQMKALTGLSQAQFDHLLSVFSDIYQVTQQKTYEEGVESGTRRRKPGGGSKGKLPTMAVVYLYPAGNSVARKSGKIRHFSRDGKSSEQFVWLNLVYRCVWVNKLSTGI
jgi:hypothetical protein